MNSSVKTMKPIKRHMAIKDLEALKIELTEFSALGGELVVENKDGEMHGRWFFLQLLSDILSRKVSPEDVYVASYSVDASLIRSNGRKGHAMREDAAAQLNKAMAAPDTFAVIFRQNTWKIIRVKGWRDGVQITENLDKAFPGMSLLGNPGSGKSKAVLAGTTFARMSGFFGACLAWLYEDEARSVRYQILTAAKQEEITKKELEEAAAAGSPINLTSWGMPMSLKPVHDGLIQLNGRFAMRWLFGQDWKKRGIIGLPEGTVLKTFRMAVKGQYIVKGNAVIRWDMPPDVDLYIHEENIKKDWLPSFDCVLIHGIVDHKTVLRTDRQWLTMFMNAAKAVFLDYVVSFFARVETAIKGGESSLRKLLGEAIDIESSSEEDFFENEEAYNPMLAAKILAKVNLGHFPQLTSQITNILTGGTRMGHKISKGSIPIDGKLAERAYVLPDLTGFGRDGYYYLLKSTLRGNEAVCGTLQGEAAVTRSPHSNPWEVAMLLLIKAKDALARNVRVAIGTVQVSVEVIAPLLKTLGGADLDDQVGVNIDKRVVEAVRPQLTRPNLPYDKALADSFRLKKAEPVESITWAELIRHNVIEFMDGLMAVIGAWASTVCRYVAPYDWLRQAMKDAKLLGSTFTKEQFESALGELPLKGILVQKSEGKALPITARYRPILVKEIVFKVEHGATPKKDAWTEWLPLTTKLWNLFNAKKVYTILLQPWFGEAFIDAGNGKPSGDYNIVGLFNAICGVLDKIGLGEVYCFSGSKIFRLPFGLSEMFQGSFNIIALDEKVMVEETVEQIPGMPEKGYVFDGAETVAINGVVKDLYVDLPPKADGTKQGYFKVSSLYVRKGGRPNDAEALLPMALDKKGKPTGKHIAYKLWDDEGESTRSNVWTAAFYKKVWRPALKSWKAKGISQKMAAALYLALIEYKYEAVPTSQFEWNSFLKADRKQLELVTGTPEGLNARMAKMLGAINICDVKKAELMNLLRGMAGSGVMPEVNLPESMRPDVNQSIKAKAIIFSYIGCTLADSMWRLRDGLNGTNVPAMDLFHLYRAADAKKLAETNPALELAISKVCALLELPEKGANLAKIMAFHGILNDRLSWMDEMSPRTAFMVEKYGTARPAAPEPSNREEVPDDMYVGDLMEGFRVDCPDLDLGADRYTPEPPPYSEEGVPEYSDMEWCEPEIGPVPDLEPPQEPEQHPEPEPPAPPTPSETPAKPVAIMLAGPPNAGKSTLGQKIAKSRSNFVHIEVDKLRTEAEWASKNYSPAITRATTMAIDLLKMGTSVVLDCTNTVSSQRKARLKKLEPHATVKLVIVEESKKTCLAREATRGRDQSASDMIEKMFGQGLFTREWYDQAFSEGWDTVHSYSDGKYLRRV